MRTDRLEAVFAALAAFNHESARATHDALPYLIHIDQPKTVGAAAAPRIDIIRTRPPRRCSDPDIDAAERRDQIRLMTAAEELNRTLTGIRSGGIGIEMMIVPRIEGTVTIPELAFLISG